MKKTELKEKAGNYGFSAMTDAELIALTGYRGTPNEYFLSAEFKAAKELTRRRTVEELPKITSSKAAQEYFSFLETEQQEHFYAMYLNRQNRVIKVVFISKGSTVGTLVDVQEVLRQALILKAQGVILCHNHPSGVVRPSDADVRLTKQIKEGGKLVEVQILDHVIIGDGGKYYSFADEGMI
jgi:DNA repair protein RadC